MYPLMCCTHKYTGYWLFCHIFYKDMNMVYDDQSTNGTFGSFFFLLFPLFILEMYMY